MSGPVEVWLTQTNIAVHCRIVREDESAEVVPVASLSMRGAQREITSRLQSGGYIPAGRWVTAAVASTASETFRRFRERA